jgi:hypothetical protein
MFKKALQKLRKIASKEPEAPKAKLSSSTSPSPRLLTAEGWKRLMMKKPRKS